MESDSCWVPPYCFYISSPTHTLPARCVAKYTSMGCDLCRKQDLEDACWGQVVAYFLLIITHPQKVQSMPEDIMPRVKMCVFLQGREMSHRKYYKGGLNFSAVQILLRPHALYSSNVVEPTSSHSR